MKKRVGISIKGSAFPTMYGIRRLSPPTSTVQMDDRDKLDKHRKLAINNVVRHVNHAYRILGQVYSIIGGRNAATSTASKVLQQVMMRNKRVDKQQARYHLEATVRNRAVSIPLVSEYLTSRCCYSSPNFRHVRLRIEKKY